MNRTIYVNHNQRRVSYELDASQSLADQVAELARLLDAAARPEEYILSTPSQNAYLTAGDWRKGVFPKWLQPNCELLLTLSPPATAHSCCSASFAPTMRVRRPSSSMQ